MGTQNIVKTGYYLSAHPHNHFFSLFQKRDIAKL